MPQRYTQSPLDSIYSAANNQVFNNGNPQLSTAQADDASQRSIGTANASGREEALFQNDMRRQNMQDDGAFQIQQQGGLSSQVYNPAANANTARSIALNTAQTLNNMYANSSANLLNAANNTNNALNQSAATVAGLFR